MSLLCITAGDWIDPAKVVFLEDLGGNITRIGFEGGQAIRVTASSASLATAIEEIDALREPPC